MHPQYHRLLMMKNIEGLVPGELCEAVKRRQLSYSAYGVSEKAGDSGSHTIARFAVVL